MPDDAVMRSGVAPVGRGGWSRSARTRRAAGHHPDGPRPDQHARLGRRRDRCRRPRPARGPGAGGDAAGLRRLRTFPPPSPVGPRPGARPTRRTCPPSTRAPPKPSTPTAGCRNASRPGREACAAAGRGGHRRPRPAGRLDRRRPPPRRCLRRWVTGGQAGRGRRPGAAARRPALHPDVAAPRRGHGPGARQAPGHLCMPLREDKTDLARVPRHRHRRGGLSLRAGGRGGRATPGIGPDQDPFAAIAGQALAAGIRSAGPVGAAAGAPSRPVPSIGSPRPGWRSASAALAPPATAENSRQHWSLPLVPADERGARWGGVIGRVRGQPVHIQRKGSDPLCQLPGVRARAGRKGQAPFSVVDSVCRWSRTSPARRPRRSTRRAGSRSGPRLLTPGSVPGSSTSVCRGGRQRGLRCHEKQLLSHPGSGAAAWFRMWHMAVGTSRAGPYGGFAIGWSASRRGSLALRTSAKRRSSLGIYTARSRELTRPPRAALPDVRIAPESPPIAVRVG